MLRLLFVSLLLASGALAQTRLDDARALSLSGDAPGALDLLLAEESLDEEAARLAARLALDLGRPHVAARVLADADSADAQAQFLLGQSLQALGDLRRAEAAYARAHRTDSTGAATAALALLVSRRNPHEAVPLYRLLVARDSTNPAHLGALGRALVHSDSTEEAVPVLRQAFALYPRDEATAIALARVLERDSTLADHLDAALAALPQSAELWRLRGADLMRRGASPEAVEAYRTALLVSDSTASRLRDLGVAQFYAGTPAEALATLRLALARDSTDATTLRVAGFAAHAENETDLALDLLARAMDALGRVALADLAEQTAQVYSHSLRDEEALRHIALAEALAPERATIVLNRGVLLQQAGRYREALAAYREFVERAGPEEAAYLPLAQERIAVLENVEAMRQEAEARRVQEDLRRRLNE